MTMTEIVRPQAALACLAAAFPEKLIAKSENTGRKKKYHMHPDS